MLRYLCACVCINTQTYVCICKQRHTKSLPNCGFVAFFIYLAASKKFMNSLLDLWALSFGWGRVFQAFSQCQGTVLCRSRISDLNSVGHLVCYLLYYISECSFCFFLKTSKGSCPVNWSRNYCFIVFLCFSLQWEISSLTTPVQCNNLYW